MPPKEAHQLLVLVFLLPGLRCKQFWFIPCVPPLLSGTSLQRAEALDLVSDGLRSPKLWVVKKKISLFLYKLIIPGVFVIMMGI